MIMNKKYKSLSHLQKTQSTHWVGDGFPVRNLFSYSDIAEKASPFLMLDYAGPYEFSPTSEKRGVGSHPHRGFETVTLVYHGELEHRDSSGGGGIISTGDVQWMTAASGLVHEEFHSPRFSQSGGLFEVVQLWVNLPRAQKMSKPRYQSILNTEIPRIELPDDAGHLRLIAGNFQSQSVKTLTHSPLCLYDIALNAGKSVELSFSPDWNINIFCLDGGLHTHPEGPVQIQNVEMGIFSPAPNTLEDLYLRATDSTPHTRLLVMAGQPIQEPIIGYGPFVMNTEAEIRQAFLDFKSGKMHHL